MYLLIRSLITRPLLRLLGPSKVNQNTITTNISNISKCREKMKIEPEVVNNEPIKFFGSQAALWRAKQSRSGGADEVVWFQPYVISTCLAVFLIYFCILREESDIDAELGKGLFDRIEGLEQTQLKIRRKYNLENNLDVTDLENRMKELGMTIEKP